MSHERNIIVCTYKYYQTQITTWKLQGEIGPFGVPILKVQSP